MPSSPQADQLGIFSEPSRFLKMEVTPPLSDMVKRCHFEDVVRHEARAVNSEVGIVVVSDKTATYVFLIDLQPDLLGDSQEKLFHLANRIFGFDDPAGPTIAGSKRRKRGSTRLRQALVSGSGDSAVPHSLTCRNFMFTGEATTSKVRIVAQDTDVTSEYTIVGISRGSTLRLQLKHATGRYSWASLKVDDFDLKTLNSVLDKHFPQLRVDIAVVRDNGGALDIKAAELVAALAKPKARDANSSSAPTDSVGVANRGRYHSEGH